MTSTAPARRLTSPDLSPLTRSETDSLQADTRWRGAKAHGWVRRVSTTRIGRRMAVAADTGDRCGLELLDHFHPLERVVADRLLVAVAVGHSPVHEHRPGALGRRRP